MEACKAQSLQSMEINFANNGGETFIKWLYLMQHIVQTLYNLHAECPEKKGHVGPRLI